MNGEKKRLLGIILLACGLFGCGHTLVNTEQLQQEGQEREEMQGRILGLQAELEKAREKQEQVAFDRKKLEDEVARQIEEVTLQLRLVQASIEKSGDRDDDVVRKVESNATEQAQHIGGLRTELQTQMNFVQNENAALKTQLDASVEKVSGLSIEMETLKAQTFAALNEQQAQAGTVHGRLDEILKTLEALGQKMMAKLDEHEHALRKARKRLEALEKPTAHP